MAKIKKKTSVQGMVPAEVVAAAAKEKDPAVALYESLSIKVKPENETAEQRKSRIMRRQLICGAFGISADELDAFLEENKNFQNDGAAPSQSDADILRDSRNVAAGQQGAIRGNKRGRKEAFIGLGIAVVAAFFPEIAVITLVYTAGKTLLSDYFAGKAQVGNVADGNEKNRNYMEKLKGFMEKVEALDHILKDRMDDIMQNKKTMKPKEFTQYKKTVIAEIREEMKEHGFEIKVDEIEEKGNTSVEKQKQENSQQEVKTGPEQPKVEGQEKKDVVEMEA